MKKFLCWLRGHKLVLDLKGIVAPNQLTMPMPAFHPWRIRCTRCGQADPYREV